jgi:ABC-2 type transport system permease protein
MIARIGRLMAGEFIKIFSQPFLYIALAILAFVTIVFGIMLPVWGGHRETAWRSYHSVLLFGYAFKYGLYVATYVLLIFSSMIFAGEFDRGTIKNLLTRPVTRLDFFISKCLTVTALAAMLFGYVFVVSAGYGLGRGDLGPVWDDGQYLMQRSAEEILGHARKAVLMSMVAFLAAGFLGILVSNFTESSGYSVAIALIVFLVSDLTTGVVGERVKQKLFIYYPAYAINKLIQFGEGTTTRWNPDIDAQLLYVAIPILYMILFIPLAFSIFRARNITA